MSDNVFLDGAFPFVSQGGIHQHQVFMPGMTKRELFAAMAMNGMLSGENGGFAKDCKQAQSMDENYQFCATYAVGYADALLAELAKDIQQ